LPSRQGLAPDEMFDLMQPEIAEHWGALLRDETPTLRHIIALRETCPSSVCNWLLVTWRDCRE
jgi:hypothetical protein